MTTAEANAARLGMGLAAVCADFVESLNTIIKRVYSDPEATTLERKVVLQV